MIARIVLIVSLVCSGFVYSDQSKDVLALISDFKVMTKVQRDRWTSQNEWKYAVSGACEVSEVSRANWLSEVRNAQYEVVCELTGGDRVVLFYKSDRIDLIENADRGMPLRFSGKLKTIRDWSFWTTAYVLHD